MMNYNVIFDRANKKVGFARANCDRGTKTHSRQNNLAVGFVFAFAAAGLLGVALSVLCRRGKGWTHLSKEHGEESEMQILADHESTRGGAPTNVFTISDDSESAYDPSPREDIDTHEMEDEVDAV